MVANLAEAQNHSEQPEDFLRHHREIVEAAREHSDTGTALARTKKSAKGGSVNLDAYKILEKIRKLDDDEQIVVLRKVFLYATWLSMPIGTQYSLMDAPQVPVKSKAQLEQDLWEVGEAGLNAGRDGETADINPFPAGTEKFVRFAKKHAEGLAERATAAGLGGGDEEDNGPVADQAKATAVRGKRPGGRGRGRHSNGGATGELLAGGLPAH